MKHCFLVWVTLIAPAAACAADDWPEFRGPTGQGLLEKGGLPAEWSATRNVAWKQAIPGALASVPLTPAVWAYAIVLNGICGMVFGWLY